MNKSSLWYPVFYDRSLSFIQRSKALWQAISTGFSRFWNDGGWDALSDEVFNILRYSWRHGIILLLFILPVYLLIGMDQGKDLIFNMLHPEGKGVWMNSLVRTIWFLLMLTLTAFSIWAIPGIYLDYEFKKLAAFQAKQQDPNLRVDDEHRPLLSMSSHYLRVLAILPILFYGLAFIWVIKIHHVNLFGYSIFNILFNLFIICAFFAFVYSTPRIRYIFYALIVCFICIPVLFVITFNMFPEIPEYAYAIMGSALLIVALLCFGILHRWEMRFEETPSPAEQERLRRWGNRIYRSVAIGIGLNTLAMASAFNAMHMTAIPVFIFLMCIYIFGFNYLSYWFKTLTSGYRFIFFLVLVALGFYLTNFQSNGHYIHLVDQREIPDRPDLDSYTAKWFADRESAFEMDSGRYTIYLIAGEGGGSRAGFWTTKILSLLDSVSAYQFSKNVFAISTVSGSSVASSAWLKWLKYAQENQLDLQAKDSISTQLANNIFNNNFVTGSLIDLFINDIARSFSWKIIRSGRNLRLQQEENTAFLHALDGRGLSLAETFRPMADMEATVVVPRTNKIITNYQFLPIQAAYFDKNKQIVTQFPLAFFNTTQMSTGRKGMLSPVRLPATFSHLGIDVIDTLHILNKEWNGKKTISLGAANNLSELFPFFSAFAYLDDLGNFMDGGGYENKGLSTTSEMYDYLSAFIQNKGYAEKVKLVVLSLENGAASSELDYKKERQPKLQLFSMISQASAQPFKATTEKFKTQIIRTVPDTNRYFISLSNYTPFEINRASRDSLRMALPLARDLSGVSLNIMDQSARNALDTILPWLQRTDPVTFPPKIKI
ncbi:MAG: hypothetical protein KA479_05740 [Saprospiraceae bacterium]|nr:hypothetical protein [Saprospiraceae bacterium]